MKTWLYAFAGLAVLGISGYWLGVEKGHAQERAGSGSVPWDGQAPGELLAFPPGGDPVGSFTPPGATQPMPLYLGGNPPLNNPSAAPPAPDLTQPYLVTTALGPWMVCVTCYVGSEAPAMAVQLVQELRGTYKLPAFLFNHGAEERRKEMERVMEIVRKQREYLKQMNAPLDATTKIRVPHMHIEEQCAVLVGGYKDMEAAKRQLDAIKKLPPPDAKRIKMDEMFIVTPKGSQKVPVNPFTHSLVVRNPTVPAESAPNQADMDLAFLKKLNAGEPLSLLQCPKKYTLAICQFQRATVVESRTTSSSFLDSLGLGSHGVAHEDAEAQRAHQFAGQLRSKMHLEAYALHTRFSSIVTVGSYDNPEDPRLKHDVERLNNFLNTSQLQQVVRLFPQPMPMAVPR